MPTFKKAEIRHGGKLIRTNVELEAIVLVTEPSAGRRQWSGTLRPPNNIGLIKGETYTLILPGYSPAKIKITDEANPADGSVPFQGIGHAPKSKGSEAHVERAK